MPAALTHVIASSSIRPVGNQGMMTPLAQAPIVGPPSDPQRRAQFDEIERQLRKPLPELSRYQIGHQHRIRHGGKKNKRRAAGKRSTTNSQPMTPKYLYNELGWYIEVRNKSVLVNRHQTEHGKFLIRPEPIEPASALRNITDGRPGKKKDASIRYAVAIKSVLTTLFICMNHRGVLYTSPNKTADCVFLQNHSEKMHFPPYYYYFHSETHPRGRDRCTRKSRGMRRKQRERRSRKHARDEATCRWFLSVRKKKGDESDDYKLATFKFNGTLADVLSLRKKKRKALHFMEVPTGPDKYHTRSPQVFTFPGTTTPPSALVVTPASKFTIEDKKKPAEHGGGGGRRGGHKKQERGGCNVNNLLSGCRTREKAPARRSRGRFSIRRSRRPSRRKGKASPLEKGIFQVQG